MKNLKGIIFLNLFFILLLTSCMGVRNTPAKLIEPLYAASIADAAYPEMDEIAPLTKISKDNSKLVWKTIEGKDYLLVATWTSEKSTAYYPKEGVYNTGKYPIWVTAIPDLQERCNALRIEKSKDVPLRLKQLLGLPPAADKSYFITFWVQPADLFRPCPDKEINDEMCGLCFSEAESSDENANIHETWINQLRLNSYYNCKGDKYPWTQLGYTYDWHPRNKSHVGISEFVIRANSDIYINKIEATNDYLGL
ncbi:MAG: hypothetical protein ACI97N_002138 [Cognaticolwellia sp.]|jgi:hypothetical protein